MSSFQRFSRFFSRLGKRKKEPVPLPNTPSLLAAETANESTKKPPKQCAKEANCGDKVNAEEIDNIDEKDSLEKQGNHDPDQSSEQEQIEYKLSDLDGDPILEAEEIWDEAYDRIKQDEGMKPIVAEYERTIKSALYSKTGERINGEVPLPRLLASLDDRSLQDLMQDLVEASSDTPTVLKTFDTFSKIFNSANKDISTLLSAYPPASVVWVGVCLALVPLVKYGDQINANNQGLMYIMGKLPWYARLVNLLRSKSWMSPEAFRQSRIPVKEAITELYRRVIEYQLLTLRECHQKFKVFAKTIVGLQESWEGRLQDIQKAEAEVEKHMQHDFMTQLLGLLKEIKSESEQASSDLMVQLKREKDLKQQATLIAKFRLGNSHLNTDAYQDYYDHIDEPLEGTTQGIRSHPTFQEWQFGNTRSLLVVASPGTGKSVLAKHLQRELSIPNQLTVCSFFFKDRGGNQNRANIALCRILYQLFQARPELIANIADQIRNKHVDDIRPNFELLWHIFEQTARSAERDSIVILLDALDESEPDSRRTMFQKFGGFWSDAVKLFCTARPICEIIGDFLKVTDSFLNLDEDKECQASLSQDIQFVAQFRLQKFINKKEIRRQNVIDQLREKLTERVSRNRTYLFIKLLFDVLEKKERSLGGFEREWIGEFERIPGSVYDAYSELLRGIKQQGQVKTVIQIVLAAQRPLTLVEMEIALKLCTSNITFHKKEDLELKGPEIFKKELLDACNFFLVTYDERIYFIHQTVKDYLLADGGLQSDPADLKEDKRPDWLRSIDTLSCHETVLDCCMKYISAPFNQLPEIITPQEFFSLPLLDQQEKQQWYWDTFQFGEYAFSKWVVHLDIIDRMKDREQSALAYRLGDLQQKHLGLSSDSAVAFFCCSGFPSEVEARVFRSMLQLNTQDLIYALSCLVQGLIARFLRFNTTSDLSYALELGEYVVEQTPDSDPMISKMLGDLCRGYTFQATEVKDNSREYVRSLCERASRISKPGTIDHARALYRWGLFYGFSDINKAVECMEDSLVISSDLAQADRLLFLHTLAIFRGYRFKYTGDPEDLRQANENARKAAQGLSNRHPRKGSTLHVLATSLLASAAQHPDDTQYLDEAIAVSLEAKAMTLPTDHSRVMILNGLARCLIFRYERTGNHRDLADAHEDIREAVRIKNEDHISYREVLALRERVEYFFED